MARPRIVIVGLGSVGRRHLRNLIGLGCTDIVLYRSHHSTLPEAELDGMTTETTLEDVLAHRPAAAVIANPTALHVPVATAFGQAGCHLFIEKPLSHTLEGTDALADVVGARGLVATVGFQFRFHPGLRAIKTLLDHDDVGMPLTVYAHWGEYLPDWHPWEDYRRSYSARTDLGGGVLLTLCHPFDYLRWLLGEPEVVAAAAGTSGMIDIDVEDRADVLLRFPSGATGVVHLDYLQRPRTHTLQIVGSRGTIQWDDADGAVRWYTADDKTWRVIPAPADFERNTMFVSEIDHFLDCVEGSREPAVTLDDGIRALRLALTAGRIAA